MPVAWTSQKIFKTDSALVEIHESRTKIITGEALDPTSMGLQSELQAQLCLSTSRMFRDTDAESLHSLIGEILSQPVCILRKIQRCRTTYTVAP